MIEMITFFKYLAIMGLVTYGIRLIPMLVFKEKITNVFIRSFLYYVPYAVLSAMTIPAIFSSTGDTISAIVGFVCAFCLAWFEKSLLTVAAFASLAVLIAELAMMLIK